MKDRDWTTEADEARQDRCERRNRNTPDEQQRRLERLRGWDDGEDEDND